MPKPIETYDSLGLGTPWAGTELGVLLSHRNVEGTIVRDHDNKIVFDLDDWTSCDVLVIDQFQLINSYFKFAGPNRALIFKIFMDRLKAGKPTVVLTQTSLKEMFDVNREQAKFPYDFPTVILKNFRMLNLYGRFKEKRSGS